MKPPTLAGDELGVITGLDGPAIIDDEDAVRISDGGETVGDDQRGAAGRTGAAIRSGAHGHHLGAEATVHALRQPGGQ